MHNVFRATLKAFTMAFAVITIGCGDSNRALLSPNIDEANQAETNVSLNVAANESQVKTLDPRLTYFTFSPEMPHATKKGKKNKNSATEKFKKNKSGKLVVKPDKIPDSDVQLISATFTVKKKSIPKNVEISMTVYATKDLQSLVIAFTPAGLTFSPPGILELVIQGELEKETEKALTKIYHRHGEDNTVTPIDSDVEKKKKTYKVKIKVPGFSQYYWDDGSDTEGDDWWDEIDDDTE